jgi:MFS family permease
MNVMLQMGWGFDLFDSLLFTYAAPACVPYLLGLDANDPESPKLVALWTAILTSVLLVGWAIGGALFGVICDRIGRAKTMFITIVVYSVATAMCALSWSIWWLAFFRFVSALGIGGEWASGASLVFVINHFQTLNMNYILA